jgi:hypothetical protein
VFIFGFGASSSPAPGIAKDGSKLDIHMVNIFISRIELVARRVRFCSEVRAFWENKEA